MGFPILVRWHLYIESGPRSHAGFDALKGKGLYIVDMAASGRSWKIGQYDNHYNLAYPLKKNYLDWPFIKQVISCAFACAGMWAWLHGVCYIDFMRSETKWQTFCRWNFQMYFAVGTFYASAFRRRRHYVFGLSVRPSVHPSVRPSVRPKPEIPSFDMYMGPLVHPTNRNRFTACPSVRPSVRLSVRPSVRRGFWAFAGECMEGMAWNFTCWCILTIFRTD